MKQTEEQQQNDMEEVMTASFEKAAGFFREEGLTALPSIGPFEDPGILLSHPGGEVSVTISCARIDSADREVYRYTVFSYDSEPWTFPALFLPEDYEGIQLLPMLYHSIFSGMPEGEEKDDLPLRYAETRIPYLQDVLEALSLPTAMATGPDGFPYLYGEEAGEPIRFSYECIFPEWEAAVLRIESGGRTVRIPEFGSPLTAAEYEAILSEAFV